MHVHSDMYAYDNFLSAPFHFTRLRQCLYYTVKNVFFTVILFKITTFLSGSFDKNNPTICISDEIMPF